MDNDTRDPEVWILADALQRMFPEKIGVDHPERYAEMLINELRKRGVLVLMRMD